MVNRVFFVESFVYRVEKEGYQPGEGEVKLVGETLGQPTRRLDVAIKRYWQVFTKYVEKKCSSLGSQSICIYSWKHGVPFRIFPLALHAFGTVLLFEGDKPVQVLAYPFNKPLSYAKSPGISEEECGNKVPREVSVRVDGWHLTAYFNPLINRWVFATRYALHNMYYKKGRLVEEPLDSIANPYVLLADEIAGRDGLYMVLDRYRGWTFTFVLEGPEPAVTKPPYPLGVEAEKFRLYSLMARDPGGRLYTWSETANMVGYRAVETVELKPINALYEEVKRRLDVRSYFAFVESGDPENPLIVELESHYYPDAMNVRYLYDAKSAAMLVSEGIAGQLTSLVEPAVAGRVLGLEKVCRELEEMLSRITGEGRVRELSVFLVKALRDRGITGLHVDEVAKNLGEGNVKRVTRKVLALLLEGRSLATEEPIRLVEDIVTAARGFVQSIRSADLGGQTSDPSPRC